MQVRKLENYSIYGKCLEMSAAGVKLIATTDVGVRVVYYGNEDVNIFYNDIDNLINKDGEYFDNMFKKGECWKIYGGHRLWKSPEDLASYAPDNYPVSYDIKQCDESISVTFTSDVEVSTGLQKTIEITMDKSGSVSLNHSFTNKGDVAVTASLWALSVMDKGGVAYMPQNALDTGLLANRNIVLWSYTDVKDPRFTMTNGYYKLAQDRNNTNAFKIGYIDHIGVMGYAIKGGLFKKSHTYDLNASYPDYCCNTETYTNNIMLELETLSPLYTIPVGQSANHVEKWSFSMIGKDVTDEAIIEMLIK